MKNNKTKFHSYSSESGYFFFDHDRDEVINIFKNKYRHARRLLPFFRKIENDSFHTGYIAGYEDGYKDAFGYLLDELGIEKNTGDTQKDIEEVKEYLLKKKKS